YSRYRDETQPRSPDQLTSHQASPRMQPRMLTWAPPGMRSTTGKPGPGPALMPMDVVTMPGAASAAVGVSNIAATKTPLQFMANLLHVLRRNARIERAFPERLSHQPKI